MGTPFLGEIKIMSFGFAPRNWAMCNGQFLPINQNQALFSLLGTIYGGNGQTTFALPDLRGQTPIHQGQKHDRNKRRRASAYAVDLGDAYCTRTSHRLERQRCQRAVREFPAQAQMSTRSWCNLYAVALRSCRDRQQYVGGSQAHQNMQPFLTLTFCIALIGIFPSRN